MIQSNFLAETTRRMGRRIFLNHEDKIVCLKVKINYFFTHFFTHFDSEFFLIIGYCDSLHGRLTFCLCHRHSFHLCQWVIIFSVSFTLFILCGTHICSCAMRAIIRIHMNWCHRTYTPIYHHWVCCLCFF